MLIVQNIKITFQIEKKLQLNILSHHLIKISSAKVFN